MGERKWAFFLQYPLLVQSQPHLHVHVVAAAGVSRKTQTTCVNWRVVNPKIHIMLAAAAIGKKNKLELRVYLHNLYYA